MGSIALLIGLTVLACGFVVWAGLRTKKQLLSALPENKALGSLTPTGIALNVCFVLVLVVGAAARQLAPDSELGAFLNRGYGVPVGIGAAMVLFVVFARVLAKLGHPIAKWKETR